MVIQVITREKPALPRRALIASVLLLLGACAVAALLTWIRANDPRQGTIRPPGWGIVFRPPGSFGFPEFGSMPPLGTVLLLRGSTSTGDAATIAVYRLDDWHGPLENGWDITAAVHKTFLSRDSILFGSLGFYREDRKLGPRPSVEMWDPMLQLLIRAGVAPNGAAYAFCLTVKGKDIDTELYRRFDECCESVRFGD